MEKQKSVNPKKVFEIQESLSRAIKERFIVNDLNFFRSLDNFVNEHHILEKDSTFEAGGSGEYLNIRNDIKELLPTKDEYSVSRLRIRNGNITRLFGNESFSDNRVIIGTIYSSIGNKSLNPHSLIADAKSRSFYREFTIQEALLIARLLVQDDLFGTIIILEGGKQALALSYVNGLATCAEIISTPFNLFYIRKVVF